MFTWPSTIKIHLGIRHLSAQVLNLRIQIAAILIIFSYPFSFYLINSKLIKLSVFHFYRPEKWIRQIAIQKLTRQVYNLFQEPVEQTPLGLSIAEEKIRQF